MFSIESYPLAVAMCVVTSDHAVFEISPGTGCLLAAMFAFYPIDMGVLISSQL
jgi:hypothetical protein